MKIRLVGAGFFREDGHTDMTKLTVAFRKFANAPMKGMTLTDTDKSCMFVQQHKVMEEPVVTLRGGGGLFGSVYV
jgi:hypothetical protein